MFAAEADERETGAVIVGLNLHVFGVFTPQITTVSDKRPVVGFSQGATGIGKRCAWRKGTGAGRELGNKTVFFNAPYFGAIEANSRLALAAFHLSEMIRTDSAALPDPIGRGCA